MKVIALLLAVFVPLLPPAIVHAAPDGGDPHIVNEKLTLANGLEVILHQDNRAPIVVVDLWYHVGSGDEVPGKSGFAHIFEHMMFQGTKHTGDDMHFKILQNIGASDVNGSTDVETTRYYEQVPANQLETALWLESDRMGFLLDNLDEKQLDNQRDVVRNERRQSWDNRPYAIADLAMYKGLFAEGHPYRNYTIGLHEDVQSASIADVKAFFQKWYVPSNCTLLIAGDFQTETAKQLVTKWFGDFPKLPKPTRLMVPPTPITSAKREVVTDPLAKLRRVDFAWHAPAELQPGDAELDILSSELGRPGTGRLYKALMLDKQIAQSVSAWEISMRMSSVFLISAVLRDDADVGEVERIIQAEIARVRQELLDARSIARFIAEHETNQTWNLQNLLARAERLQLCNTYTGVPDCLGWDFDRYRKTNVQKIRDAAMSALRPEASVEIVTMPVAKETK